MSPGATSTLVLLVKFSRKAILALSFVVSTRGSNYGDDDDVGDDDDDGDDKDDVENDDDDDTVDNDGDGRGFSR